MILSRPVKKLQEKYKRDGLTQIGPITTLDIELIKGTSILSLVYQDTDESLILPVLQRITKTYQTYSGRDRRRGLTRGVDYLEQEIDKLRKQSATSMRAAQAYALANGLGIQDGMPAANGASGSSSGWIGGGQPRSSAESGKCAASANCRSPVGGQQHPVQSAPTGGQLRGVQASSSNWRQSFNSNQRS